MSYGCPVCNGMKSLNQHCPQCSRLLDDRGRVDDYLGDYSPYREIDDMKLTNGFADLANHTCVHALFCGGCCVVYALEVEEIRL
ncbi:hypothetical protein [Paenibacillus koleovorans]|uniref:hypothetical protein n=1 Tax=Paenibacillus koleovorans TaxID=121608 RepID=UPI000FDB5D97|nr:hypothetical protein [Paenibacillus koleovorans]